MAKEKLGEVILKLSTEDKEFIRGLDRAKQKTEQLTKKTQGLKSVMSAAHMKMLAVAAAFYTAVRAAGKLTSLYEEQQMAITKLNAALAATHGIAGLTKDELLKYGESLRKVTTYSQDAIYNAEGLMLTFTQIGKKTFPGAMEAAMDMSTMFGQELKQSVIQLGTALNDPIRGLGRLRRIGISFTQDQKDMVKALMASGDQMGAQKVILAEINREFGGVSKAAGETAVGSIERLKNAFHELNQENGRTFVNAMHPVVTWLDKVIEKMRDARKATNDYKEALDKLRKGDHSLETQLTVLRGRLRDLVNTQKANAGQNWGFVNAPQVADEIKSVQIQISNLTRQLDAQKHAAEKNKKPIRNLTSDQMLFQDVLSQLRQKMTQEDSLRKIYGEGYDAQGKKTGALKDAIKKLVENGFTPEGAGIKKLISLYGDLLKKKDELTKASINARNIVGMEYRGLHNLPAPTLPVAQRGGREVEAGANTTNNYGSFETRNTAGNEPTTGIGTKAIIRIVQGLGQVMNIFNSFGAGLMGMVTSLSSVKAILDPMTTILSGVMEILAPLINEVLAPLQGILIIIGNVLGKMLAPVIESLTPIIEVIGKAFVWLYNNAIKPFANLVIKAGNTFYNFISSIVNFFIGMINGVIRMLNSSLGWAGVKISEIATRATKKAINSGTLSNISYSDLVAKGQAAQGTNQTTNTGQGNIQQARPIDIKMYFQNNNVVGAGGMKELAIVIRDEIIDLGVLGL